MFQGFNKIRSCTSIWLALRLSFLSHIIRDKDTRTVYIQNLKLSFLKHQYSSLLSELESDMRNYSPSADMTLSTIWIFWWQGEDSMPPLVKACYLQAKKVFHDKKVVLLDQSNWSDYVEIPAVILEKVKAGIITLTHFSDILRMALLYQRGGLWMDATLFISRAVPDSIFKQPLFTLKSKVEQAYVSQCRWTSFCFGSLKGHPLVKFMQNLFFQHWQKYDQFIDYFSIDYGIRMAYDVCKPIGGSIDAYAMRQDNLYSLVDSLSSIYTPKLWDDIMLSGYFFKLNRRLEVQDQIDSNETIFGHMLHLNSDL